MKKLIIRLFVFSVCVLVQTQVAALKPKMEKKEDIQDLYNQIKSDLVKKEAAEKKLREKEDAQQRTELKKLQKHIEKTNIDIIDFVEPEEPLLDAAELAVHISAVQGDQDLSKNKTFLTKERPLRELEKREARLKRRDHKEAQRLAEEQEKERRKQQLDAEYKSGKYAYLYKVPTWPLQALVHKKPDLIDVRLQYQEAVQSYDSRGKKQNISGLIFGEDDITVKDILLASKLIKNALITLPIANLPYPNSPAVITPNPNPLDFLKDQKIVFDGSFTELRVNVGYSRNIHDNDFTFGLNLPIVRRENNLRMNVRLSDQGKTDVANAKTLQLARFGGTAEGFVLDALSYKGINFNGNEVASGLGDVTVFGNLQIHSRKCERIMVGGSFIFPTAQNRDTTKLWAPELGNGGFYGASLHASLLGARRQQFNPHVFAQATYYFPTPVTRRVPHFVTKAAGVALSTTPQQFEYQTNLTITTGAFSQLDSAVRCFSDTAIKVNVQKGAELNVEVGNIFEQFISRHGYLDIFYQFKLKGADKLGSALAEDVYDTTPLFKNTAEFGHTFGLEYGYQFDRNTRLKLGGRYTVAGNNVPELFEVTAVLSTEF